jgi:hypothetical protein
LKSQPVGDALSHVRPVVEATGHAAHGTVLSVVMPIVNENTGVSVNNSNLICPFAIVTVFVSVAVRDTY